MMNKLIPSLLKNVSLFNRKPERNYIEMRYSMLSRSAAIQVAHLTAITDKLKGNQRSESREYFSLSFQIPFKTEIYTTIIQWLSLHCHTTPLGRNAI
jgi:hypothetical protein